MLSKFTFIFIDLEYAARQIPISKCVPYKTIGKETEKKRNVNVLRPIKLKPFDLVFLFFLSLSLFWCSIADVQIKNRNKDSNVIKIKWNDLTTLRLRVLFVLFYNVKSAWLLFVDWQTLAEMGTQINLNEIIFRIKISHGR